MVGTVYIFERWKAAVGLKTKNDRSHRVIANDEYEMTFDSLCRSIFLIIVTYYCLAKKKNYCGTDPRDASSEKGVNYITLVMCGL
jgi:hypothetical protein